jgi:ABC-type transport system substrate-binding protein/serine/threonine protein kinase
MVDRVGQQLGNYRLVSLLGQGGYAEVYLGQHVRFKQQAAIKVLHEHLSGQEAEHFQQEAETIATLAHPSIVRVFDFDVQDGIPFLVMDYAPHGSLRQRYPKGRLVPIPQILSCLKPMAAALQYAHDKKFIHRDVKPENMLLGQHQEVLLSDFGIATIAHSTSSLSVSAEGTSGTLAYMAPEQIEGHPRPASDQYALAIVVYEWLCGERPFEGSVSELVAQQLSMSPPSLRERVPSIPAEIEQVVLRALAKDPKARFASVADFATALEQTSQQVLSSTAKHADEQPPFGLGDAKGYDTVQVEPQRSKILTESTPSADLSVGALEPTIYPDISAPQNLNTPQSEATPERQQSAPLHAPTAAVVSPPLEPTMPVQQRGRRLSRKSAAMLIGLVVVIIVGGVLGSLSLLAHFGMLGANHGSPALQVVRGGTWIEASGDPGSLIPNGDGNNSGPSAWMDQALYLPLFYGDAQFMIHPGAATEVPSLQNGGISPDAKTWAFHLRPHLVWSDGQPYDARDVDFTWKLWRNPKFGAGISLGLDLISSADVSADDLSITFHLTRPFAPFLADLWVDGILAPLPAHHFHTMAPEQLLKSPDNLNPKVVSGPFMMAESVPGDHYTLVRNPRYYRASEGLPYLDKVVFSDAPYLKGLQAGSLAASGIVVDLSNIQQVQHLKDYTLVDTPVQGSFEALYFNFHNTVLANHLEVRQAMVMAVDQQPIIDGPLQGFAVPLCTDHPSAYHPGFDPNADCPPFDLTAANKLLDDNGWVRGSDGVRAKGGQRLEFEYSTSPGVHPYRLDVEGIIQRNFRQIGIKLDIQNYPGGTFFGSFLPQGKASPPTGAVAGRYDIAEFETSWSYDPDDSVLLSCNQFPPQGYNINFYCNPALDKLYAQEQATADPGVRQQLFEQIHQVYLAQVPFIVLYSPAYFALAHKGTHNHLPGPFTDTYNIAEWWCDNGKC